MNTIVNNGSLRVKGYSYPLLTDKGVFRAFDIWLLDEIAFLGVDMERRRHNHFRRGFIGFVLMVCVECRSQISVADIAR